MKQSTLTATVGKGDNPFTLPESDPELYHQREYERAEEEQIRKELQLIPIEERHNALMPPSMITEMRRQEQQLALPPVKKPPRTTFPTKKETIREFIQRKREILLVKMNIQSKRELSDALEEAIETQEGKLRENVRALEENEGRYEKYEEEMKLKAEEATSRTEEKINQRIERQQLSTKLSEDIESRITQCERKIDELRLLESYKQFIDELTPQEFLQRSRKGRGGNTFITEDEDLTIHFKNPKELLERIDILEEKNLFLIENSQEAEQELEALRHKHDIDRQDIEEKARIIYNNLAHYKQQKLYLDHKIERTKSETDEGSLVDQQTMNEIHAKIEYIFSMVGGDASINAKDLDMLERIEQELDRLNHKKALLAQDNPEEIKKRERDEERARREQAAANASDDYNKKLKEKREMFQMIKKSAVKPYGKKLMIRSKLAEKVKKKKEVAPSQEELDRIEFLEEGNYNANKQ